jgi:hypothetical protein
VLYNLSHASFLFVNFVIWLVLGIKENKERECEDPRSEDRGGEIVMRVSVWL